MGGEKSGAWWIIILFLGSPPHRRGKDSSPVSIPTALRITPAWAGKRRISTMTACITRDHPRVGGEKLSSGAYVAKDKGSPPRRRGKGVNVNCSADDIGITPAWAGKRPWMPSDSSSSRDHPRVGGEKPSQKGCGSCPAGSPPHGRGKVDLDGGLSEAVGITPAWAGKR